MCARQASCGLLGTSLTMDSLTLADVASASTKTSNTALIAVVNAFSYESQICRRPAAPTDVVEIARFPCRCRNRSSSRLEDAIDPPGFSQQAHRVLLLLQHMARNDSLNQPQSKPAAPIVHATFNTFPHPGRICCSVLRLLTVRIRSVCCRLVGGQRQEQRMVQRCGTAGARRVQCYRLRAAINRKFGGTQLLSVT